MDFNAYYNMFPLFAFRNFTSKRNHYITVDLTGFTIDETLYLGVFEVTGSTIPLSYSITAEMQLTKTCLNDCSGNGAC